MSCKGCCGLMSRQSKESEANKSVQLSVVVWEVGGSENDGELFVLVPVLGPERSVDTAIPVLHGVRRRVEREGKKEEKVKKEGRR